MKKENPGSKENKMASVELGEDFPEIRESVRRICADFPNEYWMKLDETEAYPKEFVAALRRQPFGVTEPTTGTDTTKLKTRAVRDGDHYVITGQKVWTSRALHSDLMLLLARTTPRDQVRKKTEGLSVFLLDIGACRGKGLEIRPLKAMVNHNATEVLFDGAGVPAENLIGEEGQGL